MFVLHYFVPRRSQCFLSQSLFGLRLRSSPLPLASSKASGVVCSGCCRRSEWSWNSGPQIFRCCSDFWSDLLKNLLIMSLGCFTYFCFQKFDCLTPTLACSYSLGACSIRRGAVLPPISRWLESAGSRTRGRASLDWAGLNGGAGGGRLPQFEQSLCCERPGCRLNFGHVSIGASRQS